MKIKSKLILFGLILVLLIVSCNKYAYQSTKYREATEEEFILMNNAIENNDDIKCLEIDPRAEKRSYSFSDETTYDLRNHCLIEIAINTRNPKICEQIGLIENEEEFLETYKQSCIDKASE